MKRLAVALALALGGGCSSLQPASKYQGMDVRGVTVTLNVHGLEDGEAATAGIADSLRTTGARGVPAIALELATQSATMNGEDSHAPAQSQSVPVEAPLDLAL